MHGFHTVQRIVDNDRRFGIQGCGRMIKARHHLSLDPSPHQSFAAASLRYRREKQHDDLSERKQQQEDRKMPTIIRARIYDSCEETHATAMNSITLSFCKEEFDCQQTISTSLSDKLPSRGCGEILTGISIVIPNTTAR